ncbi:MAG: BadF/BadG/BcrA/BcrD ATPase family protein [Armatimonadota bacterium]
MAPIVLGVDGGQTATTAAICDLSGRLLGLGRAGPSNHISEPGGVRRATTALRRSVREALRAAGLRSASFDAAFFGMTGGKSRGRIAEICRRCVRAKRLAVDNDQVTALASVTMGKPGVVVIAGTGTIAYGENGRGQSASASGWGWLLGDEGSGFWIAKQAIAAACRAHDGRAEPTLLADALLESVGRHREMPPYSTTTRLRSLWELHSLIYSEKLSRSDIAALAAVVPEAAAKGDAAARRILREAGGELGLAAATVAERLGMHRRGVTVGMVGGVFRGSPQVRAAFQREVRRRAPKAVFADPRFPPVVGSVLLALKMARARLTREVLANLDAASAVIGPK